MKAIVFTVVQIGALAFFSGQATGQGTPIEGTPGASARNVAASKGWEFGARRSVASLSTQYAEVAYYVPDAPKRVLVLAFGYPWPDQTASDEKILSYTRMNLARWTKLADRSHVLLVAPVLGGTNFFDFRALSGRLIDPDFFVDALIDGPAKMVIPGLRGRFCLYGHSAGAQFAARYVIAHPERLQCAILSAPSTYPMPLSSVPRPFGTAPSDRVSRTGIELKNWTEAASDVPITVIVGSDDLERRPEAPGQVGETRLSRGQAWVESMHSLASSQSRPSHVTFKKIAGVDHDESSMANVARRILERFYSAPSNHHI